MWGGSSQAPLSSSASLLTPEDAQVVYLPIIGHISPVRVVVTQWNDNPYGYSYHTLGYLENTTAGAFEVTLEAGVTVYPYSIGTPEPPYTTTVQFKPALDATLPGQINPFSLGAWCYKRCEVITSVRVAQAIPWGSDRGACAPLTIARWSYRDGILSGTVRNDSAQALEKARVVVTEPYRCEWEEAILETKKLRPGQQTTFTIDPYYSYCFGDFLLIVGQGQAP